LARHSDILGTFEKALTHLNIESLNWKEFLEKRGRKIIWQRFSTEKQN
jgi:hypothetical protein